MTPSRAIKIRCRDCNVEKDKSICKHCFLQESILPNLKKIKSYCKIFCLNGHKLDLCDSPDCSLFQYRDGHNPARKGLGFKPMQNTVKNAS